MQKYNLPQNPLKETKILQDIIILLLITGFNMSQKYHLFQNPHVKLDLLLPRGQNPLSYYTL
jgi:hypothetical protein